MKRVHVLNVCLPYDMYAVFAKICIDMGITKTEAIKRCLRMIQEDKNILEESDGE